MAILIRIDGSQHRVTPKKKKFSLEEMYDLIGTDIVERVRIPGTKLWMWIDENGKLRRNPIVNAAATRLVAPYHVIVGNVLITSAGEA